ncbi:MAG: manganese efflux pump MntP family protein [Christensenellaceae bacterium]
MGLFELILIAVGLSMDAFAVAVCKGLHMTQRNYKNCFLIALFFGGFQALMPFVGWLLGTQFERYITSFDHWIAFGLLVLIGGKMIYEALSKKDDTKGCTDKISIKELFVLAIATSIDALAVGITFALLPDTNMIASSLLIGLITFGFSFAGVIIGNKFGSKYEKKAELVGGVILVAIGVKILLEHLLF